MSRSSKAGERAGARGRRGFTLVEALVALVVAGLLLPALARVLSTAWTADRAPMEVVTAVALAGGVSAGGGVPAEARARGYGAERAEAPVTLLELPSAVAPAPGGAGAEPGAAPAPGGLAMPNGIGTPSPAARARDLSLRRVSVSVRTPSGRRVVIDRIALDDAAR